MEKFLNCEPTTPYHTKIFYPKATLQPEPRYPDFVSMKAGDPPESMLRHVVVFSPLRGPSSGPMDRDALRERMCGKQGRLSDPWPMGLPDDPWPSSSARHKKNNHDSPLRAEDLPEEPPEPASDAGESGRTGSSESCLFDHQNRCPLTVAEAEADVEYARNMLRKARTELRLAFARRRKRRRGNYRRNKAEREAAQRARRNDVDTLSGHEWDETDCEQSEGTETGSEAPYHTKGETGYKTV